MLKGAGSWEKYSRENATYQQTIQFEIETTKILTIIAFRLWIGLTLYTVHCTVRPVRGKTPSFLRGTVSITAPFSGPWNTLCWGITKNCIVYTGPKKQLRSTVRGCITCVLRYPYGHRGITPVVFFKIGTFCDLFSSLYCTCAYISWFKEEGYKYLCRFVFVCFYFVIDKLFNDFKKLITKTNSLDKQIFFNVQNHPPQRKG